MGDRGAYTRSSSQRDVLPFSESFSCGEFGAFDLDLDDDDFEAMAQEAEAKAQERMNQSKGVIDGLLESDDNGTCGAGLEDDTKSSSVARQLPLRGGSALKNSRQNRSMRWEPQKILEDESEEGGNNKRDSETLVMSDEEISASSSGLRRNDTNNVDDDQGKRKVNSSEASCIGSVGAAHSTWEKAPTSKKNQTDENKSGIILASAQPSASTSAIHINAPNVIINYIIEQKVESRPPPAERIEREASAISSEADSSASWSRDGSLSNKEFYGYGKGSVGDGGRARNNLGEAVKEEDALRSQKETDVQRSIEENHAPPICQRTVHENSVPQYVTQAPTTSTQREYATEGGSREYTKSQSHDPDHSAGEDFNASQMTMSTCWSRKGGQTECTSSMSASVSSTMNGLSSVSASVSAMDGMLERSTSDRSVTKTIKVDNKASSQPYDLSELLDSLWNPDHSDLIPPKSNTVASSKISDEDNSEDGSGVFTAGVSSFCGSVASNMEGTPSLQKDKSTLSQLTAGKMPAHQTTPNSNGDTQGDSQRGPALKSKLSSWREDGEQYNEGHHSQREARGEDKVNRRQDSSLTSKARSRSPRKASDDSKARRAPPQEQMGEGNCSKTNLRKPPEPASNKGVSNVQKGRPRSPPQGKSTPQERGGACYDLRMENQRQSTFEGGRTNNQEEDATNGKPVSSTNEQSKKMSMRDLLARVESGRKISVYEDLLEDDIDPDSPKEKNPDFQMGSIAESLDGCSIASSVPEYKIDPGVAAFAKSFVDQFSKQEEDKQRRSSLEKDGRSKSDCEEVEASRTSSNRKSRRRESACGKKDNKERTMQHKNDNKTRSQSRGEKITRTNSDRTDTKGEPQSQGRRKPMQRHNSQPAPSADAVTQSESQRQGRRHSMEMRHPTQSVPQSAAHRNDEHKRKSSSRPRPQNSLRHSQRTFSSGDSQITVPVSNLKYTIGDLLQSEKDVIRDSNVEKILDMHVYDYCMVRRSGGRWTYAIVAEVSEKAMKFVLDKEGSKKKVERHALLHNVRRLK